MFTYLSHTHTRSGGEVDEKPATTAKKRRRRQNDEITELGELLPYTLDVSGSLDKLSILRLTTSYIRFQNFMTLGEWFRTPLRIVLNMCPGI